MQSWRLLDEIMTGVKDDVEFLEAALREAIQEPDKDLAKQMAREAVVNYLGVSPAMGDSKIRFALYCRDEFYLVELWNKVGLV